MNYNKPNLMSSILFHSKFGMQRKQGTVQWRFDRILQLTVLIFANKAYLQNIGVGSHQTSTVTIKLNKP